MSKNNKITYDINEIRKQLEDVIALFIQKEGSSPGRAFTKILSTNNSIYDIIGTLRVYAQCRMHELESTERENIYLRKLLEYYD